MEEIVPLLVSLRTLILLLLLPSYMFSPFQLDHSASAQNML